MWQGVRWVVQGGALMLYEHTVVKHSSSFLAPTEHKAVVGTVQTILRVCGCCSCPAVSPLVGLYWHFLSAKQKMQTVGHSITLGNVQSCYCRTLISSHGRGLRFQVCLMLSTVI